MATNKNFDIDDNLAFEDFNIDSLDADTPKGKVSKSRKIVSTLFKDTSIGASKGIRRALKSEFTETADQVDELSRAYDEGKQALSEIADQAKPAWNSVKKITLGFMPMVKNLMPKSWYDKSNAWLKEHVEEEEETPEQREARQRQEQMQASLKEIFEGQKAATETDMAYKAAETLQSNIKFKHQQIADRAMLNGLKQIVTYIHGPTTGYMKKSLELQYQHLFIAKDLFKATAQIGNILNAKLEEIKHNTAMPETVKINSMKKGGISGAIGSFASKTLGGMISSMIANGSKKIKSGLTDAQTYLGMMEGASANAEMMSPFTWLTATSGLLGLGANWFAGKALGDKLKSMSGTVKDLDQGATGILGSIQRWIGNKVKRGKNGNGGILGSILGWLAPDDEKVKSVQDEAVTDPTKAISYDVSSKTALTRIIPRHLERIGDFVEAAFSTQQKFVGAWSYVNLHGDGGQLQTKVTHKEFNVFKDELTSHEDVLKSLRNNKLISDKELAKDTSDTMALTRQLALSGPGKRIKLDGTYTGKNMELAMSKFIENCVSSQSGLDIYEIVDLYQKFSTTEDSKINWTQSVWEREVFADMSPQDEHRVVVYLYAATHFEDGTEDRYSTGLLCQKIDRQISKVSGMAMIEGALQHNIRTAGMVEAKRDEKGNVTYTNKIGVNWGYNAKDARKEDTGIADKKKRFDEEYKKFEEELKNTPMTDIERDRILNSVHDGASLAAAKTFGRVGVDVGATISTLATKGITAASKYAKSVEQFAEDKIKKSTPFIVLWRVVREGIAKDGHDEAILEFGMFKEANKSIVEAKAKGLTVSEARSEFKSNGYKPMKKDGKREDEFPCQIVQSDASVVIKDSKPISKIEDLPDFKDVQKAYDGAVPNEFKPCLTKELWEELCKAQNYSCSTSQNALISTSSYDSERPQSKVLQPKLVDYTKKAYNVDSGRGGTQKVVVDQKRRREYIDNALRARAQTYETNEELLDLPENVKSKKDIDKHIEKLSKNKPDNVEYTYDDTRKKIVKTTKAENGELFQDTSLSMSKLSEEERTKLLQDALEYATITHADDIQKYHKEQAEEKNKYLGLTPKAYGFLENILKASGKDEKQIRSDIEYIISKPSGIQKRLTTLLGAHLSKNRQAIEADQDKIRELDQRYQLTREDEQKVSERIERIRKQYKEEVTVDPKIKDRKKHLEKLNKDAGTDVEYVMDEKGKIFRIDKAELKKRDEALKFWSKKTGLDIRNDSDLARELVRQDKISEKDRETINRSERNSNFARSSRRSDLAAIQDLLQNLFGNDAGKMMASILQVGNRKALDVQGAIWSEKSRTVRDKYDGNEALEFYETGKVRSDEEKEHDHYKAVAEATNAAYEKTTPGKADTALLKSHNRYKRQRSLRAYRNSRWKEHLSHSEAMRQAELEDMVGVEHAQKLIGAYVELYEKYINQGLSEEEADKKAFEVALSRDGQGEFKSRFGELITRFNARSKARAIKNGKFENTELKSINTKLDTIINKLSTVGDHLGKGLTLSVEGAKDVWKKVTDKASSVFSSLKTSISKVASSAMDTISKAASTVGRGAKKIATTTIDKAKEMWGKGKVWINGKWESAKKWGVETWDDAKECAQGFWEKFTKKAGDAKDWLVEKGTTTKDWIIEKGTKAKNWLSETYHDARDWADKKITSAKTYLFGEDKVKDFDYDSAYKKHYDRLVEEWKAKNPKQNIENHKKVLANIEKEAKAAADAEKAEYDKNPTTEHVDGLFDRAKKTVTDWKDSIKKNFTKSKIGSAIHSVTKFIKVADYVDIYLKDKVEAGNPLLSKKKQEEGVFFKDGNKVKHSYDITEPVFDNDKNALITEDDIKTGLVDVDNKPLNPGVLNKLADTIKSWSEGGLGGALKKAWGGVKDAWGWFTGKASSGAKKTTSFFKSMFGLGGEDFAEYHNNVITRLDSILDAIKGKSEPAKQEAGEKLPAVAPPVSTPETPEEKVEALNNAINNAGDLSDPNAATDLLMQFGNGYMMSRSGERKRFNSFWGTMGKGIKGLGKLAWKGVKRLPGLAWKGAKMAAKGYWKYLKFVGKGYAKGFGLLGKGIGSLLGLGKGTTDSDGNEVLNSLDPERRKSVEAMDEALAKQPELRKQLAEKIRAGMAKTKEELDQNPNISEEQKEKILASLEKQAKLLESSDLSMSQIMNQTMGDLIPKKKSWLESVKDKAKDIFSFDKSKSGEVAETEESGKEAKTEFHMSWKERNRRMKAKNGYKKEKYISKKDRAKSVNEQILEEIKHQTGVQEKQLDTLNESSDVQDKQLKLQEDQKKLQEEANKKITDADGDGLSDGSIADQKATKERQDAERKKKLEEAEKRKKEAEEKNQKHKTAFGGKEASSSPLGKLIDKFTSKITKKFPLLSGLGSWSGAAGRLKTMWKGARGQKKSMKEWVEEYKQQGYSPEEAAKMAKASVFDQDAYDKTKEKIKEGYQKGKSILFGKGGGKDYKTLYDEYRKQGMPAAEALKKAKADAADTGLVGKGKELWEKHGAKVKEKWEKLKNSKTVSKAKDFISKHGGKAIDTAKKWGGKAKDAFLKTGAGKSIAASLKGAGPGIMAKMGPLLANPYVLAGVAGVAALGGGIYGGVKGWKNAGKNWGLKEGQKATATQKTSSMLAGALTFGFGGKKATKAVNAAMNFGGVNNLIKAFGGNKAVMDAKDIEKFQKKCAEHIKKGEKQYERMLARFNKAVAEEDWPMARSISGNEVSVAKELGKAALKMASFINPYTMMARAGFEVTKWLFRDRNKDAMTQKQIDAFTKKMSLRIQKGDKSAERILSKFQTAVADENWVLARQLSGKKVDRMITKLAKKWTRVSFLNPVAWVADAFIGNDRNKAPMDEKEIKAATERFQKLGAKSAKVRKIAARFQEAVENEDWKTARALSGNKLDAAWKRDLKILGKIGKWTARIGTLGLSMLFEGQSKNSPLEQKEIDSFIERMEKKVRKGDKMAQRRLDMFSEAVAQQQWARARKIANIKTKDAPIVKAGKAVFGFLFGRQGTTLKPAEIEKFRQSMERKIKMGGAEGKMAEKKLDAFNDAVEEQNWEKARQISKMKHQGIFEKVGKAYVRQWDEWFFGSKNSAMPESEIKEARAKLQDNITKGVPNAEKILDKFEDAVEDQNWKKARQIAGMKATSRVARIGSAIKNWWTGESDEMSEMEINKVTKDLQEKIAKGGKEGEAAQKKLEMFERAVEQRLWKRARTISGMKGEGFLSRMDSKVRSMKRTWYGKAALAIFGIGKFMGKKKGQYNINDCNNIRKELEEKAEGDDNPQIWNRVLAMFDQYVQDGNYTAAYNYADQALSAGEKELKKIDRESRGMNSIEEDMKYAARAKDIEANIRKSRDKLNPFFHPIKFWKLGRLITKVQDMSLWSDDFFDEVELDLQDIDEEAETTGDKDYSNIDRNQKDLIELQRNLRIALTKFRNENLNTFPGLAKAASDLLIKLDINPLQVTKDQLKVVFNEYQQLKKERAEEQDRVSLLQKILKAGKAIIMAPFKAIGWIFKTVVGGIKMIWKGIKWVGKIVKPVAKGVGAVLKGVCKVIAIPFKLAWKGLKGLGSVLGGIWKGIKKVGGWIGGIFSKLWGAITWPFKKIGSFFKKIFGWFGGVKDAFGMFTIRHPIDSVKRIWNAIKGNPPKKQTTEMKSRFGELRGLRTHFADAQEEGLRPMQMAEAIKNHKFESAVAYDKHGNITNAARGDEGSVDIQGEEGGTVVHNHPDGSPITNSDKEAAKSQGLKKVVVASPNGIQTTTFNSKDGIKTRFNMFGWVKKGWNAVKNAGKAVWNGAKKVGKAAWNGVKTVGGAVWKGVKWAGKTAWNGVKAVGSAVGKVAKGALGLVGGMVGKLVGPLAKAIYNKVKDMLGFGENEDKQPFAEKTEMKSETGEQQESLLKRLAKTAWKHKGLLAAGVLGGPMGLAAYGGGKLVKLAGKLGWAGIKGLNKLGWSTTKGLARLGWKGLKGLGKLGLGTIKGIGKLGLGTAKGIGKGIWGTIKGVGSLGAKAAKGYWNLAKKTTGLFGKGALNVGKFLVGQTGWQKKLRSGLWSGIKKAGKFALGGGLLGAGLRTLKRPTSNLFKKLQNSIRTAVTKRKTQLLNLAKKSPFARILAKYATNNQKATITDKPKYVSKVDKNDVAMLAEKLDTMIGLLKCVIETTANAGNGIIQNVKDSENRAVVTAASYSNTLMELNKPKPGERPLKPVEIDFRKYFAKPPELFA